MSLVYLSNWLVVRGKREKEVGGKFIKGCVYSGVIDFYVFLRYWEVIEGF